MAALEILLLGTGTPLTSPDRCGNAQVVMSGGDAVLIDCGWGSSRRLSTLGPAAMKIDTVVFTHMHSDHVTDFPDFMMQRWTAANATKPLTVYGPRGTKEVVEGFRQALNPDVRYRKAHHGDKLDVAGMECIVHEVDAMADASHVVTVGAIDVEAFEVDHQPVEPAFGYRVRAGGKTVVFSGDTKKCESLVNASKGADLLVSEAVNLGLMEQRIKFLRGSGQDRLAEILTEACDYHSPTTHVAEMARDAGVPEVVLTHLIPPIPNEGPLVEQFVAGMADAYKGKLRLGRDLERIVVE